MKLRNFDPKLVPDEKKPWAIFVAGSRELRLDHLTEVARFLEPFSQVHGSLVIHGGGPAGRKSGAVGCDKLTDTVARVLRMRVFVMLPLWDIHGPPGGPIRNELMVNVLTSHHMAGYRLAAGFFPTGGPGTANAIELTRAVSTVPIQVSEFPQLLE